MAGRAPSSFTYDVYLSFRGVDTRTGFTGNLYHALSQRGIRTFVDDVELQRGEQIAPVLLKAIEESRIAIVVLSKNYAASSFCLDELATILECVKQKDRLVLPVFYGLDPSDVRHLRGSYGEALDKHEERFRDNKEKVHRWRMALHQVANLSGFHFRDEYQYEFIGRIVEAVSSKINHAFRHIADYPVGLGSRVLKVTSLLEVGSDDAVHMVGIYGIGGIGKTTIARAVYDSIAAQFEGLCFLDNVRENSSKYGLVHLQEILLSSIVGDKGINILNVSEGISLIKQRLCTKKVLLVLDDVDNQAQLQAIVGTPDRFGFGSRVIITTRDKGLLASHGIERSYEVEELNNKEALMLLSLKAFKTVKVDSSYVDILKRAVAYASRLPLALEVIGSNLFGKQIEEWEYALDHYKRIPHKEILRILRLSFDSLEIIEKEVFLDIACCFRGYKLADVEDILCAHYDFSIKYCIGVLIEKSLIKIYDDLVTLHDLIQDMGREIVRQESPEEPGKRSRLWFFEDVVQVLEEDTGSDRNDILILDFPKDEVHSNGPKGEEVCWDGEAFKKMKNLRTLIIRNGQFSQGPKHLPNSLRVLKWMQYPSPTLPCDFYPMKLSILELTDGCLKACEPIQSFISLRVLDFGYSEYITQIPDLSGVPNLEKLSFKHCENLIKIHDSVGCLEKLRILDAGRCRMLKTFPPIRLTSLEQLNLSHCSVLESFPHILGKMENITELHIMGSPIKELPFSIQNLTRLQKLELQFCGMLQLPSSIVTMQELGLMHVSRCEGLRISKQEQGEEMVSSNTERLIFSYCNLSDEFLPIALTWFANVKDLNLSGNNFTILDACVKECHFLRNLKVDDCRFLREIRAIPWKLETFSAKGCTSLKYLDLTVLPACTEECHFLRELILDDCVYLREIRGVLPNLDHFSAKNCTSLTLSCTSKFLNQEFVEAGNKIFSFPGTKIPEWFTHMTRGGSMSFWFRIKFPAISLCLVIGPVNEQPIIVKFSPRVFVNGNEVFIASQTVYDFRIATDHIFLFDLQLLKLEDNLVFSENDWNHVEVSYADVIINNEVPINLVAKHSGIYIFKKSSSMEHIQFINPLRNKKSDFLSTSESELHQLLKEKQVDKGVSETQFMQKQQHLVLLTPHVDHGREQLSLLPAQAIQNLNWGINSMEGPYQRVKTTAERPQEAQTIMPSSPILRLAQPLSAEAEIGHASQSTSSVERHWEVIGGETLKRCPEDEVHPTAIPSYHLPVKEEGAGDHDAELEALSVSELEYEDSYSNTEGLDLDDPTNHQVNTTLFVGGKQTATSGPGSGDASLPSIQDVINDLEILMVKDLSEVSSDPATHAQLDLLLDLLCTSRHPKVTVEVKEALVEFKRVAFESFQQFQATIDLVKKLQNFEEQSAIIQEKKAAVKNQWRDIQKSKKEISLAIKDKNKKKREIQAEIATLREQLATKERGLEQLVSDVKSDQVTLAAYSMTSASLGEQAQALTKEASDLFTANTGVEEAAKHAEEKQNRLKLTWSTDLSSQFIKIKEMILGRYE